MEVETCKRELVIEIPVDVVRRESESITAQYRRVARIPGFRPGHAPVSLVWQRFRDDIRHEVVQSLLPKFFENAVKEQKLSPVGRPSFADLKFEDNQPVTCKATFEVYPEFELKEYKGLEVEEEPGTVTDADVDQAVEELRQRAAVFEVVQNRPAALGDYVAVSYQGRDVKNADLRPIEAREAIIHLGGQETVGAFTENLEGSKPGDVREFEVAYPADYPQKSLSGKIFRYRVAVQSIKNKVVPAIDDDLAKSVGEFSTLEELRSRLRDDLKRSHQKRTEGAAKQKLLEKLLQAHPFPVPDVLVEAQLDRKVENAITKLLAQGIDPRTVEVDWRKIREESRPEAERDVHGSLVLNMIAEAEKIEVTDEELDNIIREMAEESREAPAALKTRLTRDGLLDKIKTSRRNQKALEFVYHNAKIIRKSE